MIHTIRVTERKKNKCTKIETARTPQLRITVQIDRTYVIPDPTGRGSRPPGACPERVVR
jgi:hypothetical protein